MNEKEILTAFLGATLNLPTDKLAEILYKKADDGTITEDLQENALDALKNLDKERIGKLKPDTKEFFNNGYKKAQSEVAANWEKQIREKFGVEAELTGEELLAAALEKVSKPSKLDDDKVKTHPLFLALEKKAIEDLKAAKTEWEKALADFKAQQLIGSRRAMAKAKAKEVLLAMKPVLEDDPTIADTRIADYLREFDELDYEELEGGGLLPMKDGKRMENEHAHPVDFDTLAKQRATRRFKFQVQDPKGNGGNKNEPGPGGNAKQVAVPKTEAELWTAYNATKDDAEQKAILEAWEKANGEITFQN